MPKRFLKFLSVFNLVSILVFSISPFVFAPQEVVAFSSTDEPVFVEQWGGLRESDNGKFYGPLGIAIDSNDNVYVGDTNNKRIQKFDSSGNFITKWGSYGAENGQFKYPNGIATDSTNNVYVTDRLNNRLQKFTYDQEAPVLNLTAPSASGNNPTPDVIGTAIDGLTPITSVEYQVDGTLGNWSACNPSDGLFNDKSESFNCSVQPSLLEGAHTLYVRSTDSKTNTNTGINIASLNYLLDITNPTNGSIIINSNEQYIVL
ncbi:MAG: hypothetical protein FJ044_02420 [Candidatus Cloacimonetes bacterium]|nr:hypothetical protein [Candidatus Cloacimonadota bacterium]